MSTRSRWGKADRYFQPIAPAEVSGAIKISRFVENWPAIRRCAVAPLAREVVDNCVSLVCRRLKSAANKSCRSKKTKGNDCKAPRHSPAGCSELLHQKISWMVRSRAAPGEAATVKYALNRARMDGGVSAKMLQSPSGARARSERTKA